MKLKRVRQVILFALVLAVLNLGFSSVARADTWIVYGDNYTSKQTCLNRGQYLMVNQPYLVTFLDYLCQPNPNTSGRWLLLMLEKDPFGCLAARVGDDVHGQSGASGKEFEPADGC